MKSLLALAVGLAFAGNLSAQSLDCAALANSPLMEPPGYADACGSVAPSPNVGNVINVPTSTAFTVDIRGQGAARPQNTLYSFTLNNFPAQTARGTTAGSVFGMDFTPTGSTLYGVTGSAGTPASTLGTINPATGAFTSVAALSGLGAGENATGLTIHPRTGVAYLSTFATTPGARLYSLNLATGAATLIGSMGPEIMIDIAMNCSGELYAHSISTDSLFRIDAATGAATLIGAHGLAANFAQGMDFDNEDNTLYAFIYTGSGTNRFGTFNLATGAFTALATDNPLGEFEGAVPTQCPAEVLPVAAPVNNPMGMILLGLMLVGIGAFAVTRRA